MVTPHVLLAAILDDGHARIIRDRLTGHFGARATVWDSSGIPASQQLAIASDTGSVRLSGVEPDSLELTELRACWWRRPAAADIPEDIGERRVRHYCRVESDRAIRGALMASGVPLVNRPPSQSVADHKPFQLKIARDMGLRIPRTLTTNDPDAARAFAETNAGQCVFKAFNSPSWKIVETREFQSRMAEDLDTLRYAPVTFQEHISRGRDIRVFATRHALFASESRSAAPEAYLDWRLDTDLAWTPCDLTPDVAGACAEMLDRLDLHYGCFDFRETPDGDTVFFEVNPAGQFLFQEQPDRHDVADAFCELLLSADGA